MTHHSTTSTSLTPWNWGAVIGAGLIAGLVFMVMEMMLVATVGGGSLWGPPRMIAAIGLGREVLPTGEAAPTFDAGVMMTAMAIHFALSLVLAVVMALILRAMKVGGGAALALGGVFGLIVYFITFYGFTALFPWFENARNWISILSHIVFGMVLAGTYRALAR